MIAHLNQPAHHLESLGWTLIHFCWQAAAIALTYKTADLFVTRGERTTSQTRYLLALAAMLGMFVAAVGTFSYEEVRLGGFATPDAVADTVAYNVALPSVAADTPTNLPATPSILPTAEAVLPWLDALWMLGVLALSVRTIGGWLLIQRLRTTALQNVPPQLMAAFDRIAHRVGVQSQVALRLSTRIISPLAIGMFHSIILLPVSALTTLTPEQLEAVLAHELAHIRRADYLWNILQTMIETLFFFHPAVWWVGTNLRQQRELCCDDIAIASCSDPVTYATALLLLEEHRSQFLARAPHTHGLALALDGHQTRFNLRSRIVRILGVGNEEGVSMQPISSTRSIAPLSILGVCAALAFFLMPLPQLAASLLPAPDPAAQASLPKPPVAADAPAVAAPTAQATAPAIAQAATDAVQSPVTTSSTSAMSSDGNGVQDPVAIPAPAVAPVPTPAPVPPTDVLPRDFPQITLALDIAQQAADNATNAVNQSKAYADQQKSYADQKSSYIEQMRAAGYDTDLDHYISLKIQGITPEYAKKMADLGYGKPDTGELLALKIQGITPEYVKQLKDAGIKPDKLHDIIAYHMFKVTPEYVAAMKAAGFGEIPSNKLIELRVQNISPEFARSVKQQFPDVTINQLVQMRIFNINGDFIAKAKALGLTPLTVDKLVRLRISGLIDDEASNRDTRRFRDDGNDDSARTQLKDKTKHSDKLKTKDKSVTQP